MNQERKHPVGALVKVAEKSEIPPGTGKRVQAGGREIALFNLDGKIHAVDAICPHAGGPLDEGGTTGTAVMCPWHGWEFDLETGRCLFNEGVRVPTFKVKEEGEDIYVEA